MVSLQVLGLAGGECLQLRQSLMDNLLTHADCDNKNLVKCVISILIKGDIISSEGTRSFENSQFPTNGSDADDETNDDTTETVYAPSPQKLLSKDALDKVLNFLSNTSSYHINILEYGLCQIHRILLFHDDDHLPNLCVGYSILSFLKGMYAI